MIIWKIGYTLDFGINIINPLFGCAPTLLKPHAGGQLPYSNFKIGQSNTPTNMPSFSKYCVKVPLYKMHELPG